LLDTRFAAHQYITACQRQARTWTTDRFRSP
jgi:hypothetical protein